MRHLALVAVVVAATACATAGRGRHFSGPDDARIGTYRVDLMATTESGEQTFRGWLVLSPARIPGHVRQEIAELVPFGNGIDPARADACFRWEIDPDAADSTPPTVVPVGLASWVPKPGDSLQVQMFGMIDYFYSANLESRGDTLSGEAPYPGARLADEPEPPRDRLVAIRVGDVDFRRCIGP